MENTFSRNFPLQTKKKEATFLETNSTYYTSKLAEVVTNKITK